MESKKLGKLNEAKGTKPGERYNNARNSNGPSGVTSSPIGKSNYNPEKPEFTQKDPVDEGSNINDVFRVLSKSLSLLKDDDTFEDQIKGVLNGFKKNRKQISIEQETILKNYDKIIDKYDGLIAQYTKRLFSPSFAADVYSVGKSKVRDTATGRLKDTANHALGKGTTISGKQNSSKEELEEKLEEAKTKKEMYTKILDDTRADTESISLENEELNEEYLHQFLLIVNYTTKRLYKRLSDSLGEEAKSNLKTVVPLHELDVDRIDKAAAKEAEVQLQLLEMLMSDSPESNPLLKFLDLVEENYDEAKEKSYLLKNGDNYSITIEILYKHLPLFKLSNYYYMVIMKKPAIKLTTHQKTIVKGANNKAGGILAQLDSIKSETQFEKLKPELVKYIDNNSDIKGAHKQALMAIVNGPFITRKGAANAAFKVRSSLKASSINESFDAVASRALKGIVFDADDFKLDLIEILSSK